MTLYLKRWGCILVQGGAFVFFAGFGMGWPAGKLSQTPGESKQRAANSEDISDVTISEKSSCLEQLLFNARMSDSMKAGVNVTAELQSDGDCKPCKLLATADAVLAARDKEASIKNSLKTLEKHMRNNEMTYGSMLLQNTTKAFQVMASMGLPEAATARKVFPPSAQPWCKTIYAPQLYKCLKGYEYHGPLPFCVGEARLVLKGKEWAAGLPYHGVPGADHAEKMDWVKSARWLTPE